MSSVPQHQKALFLLSKQGEFAVRETAVPRAGPGELLVKVKSTALNPVEWKIQTFGSYVENYPVILGTDVAGIVEEVGEGVVGFSKGDRVLSQGSFLIANEYATFQQYMLTAAKHTAKIPSKLSFDEAATVPACVGIAAIALFNEDDEQGGSARLYPPWKEGGYNKYANKPIVIFGGASSSGQYIIQLAKLAGFSPIIATASLHNTSLLTILGATHVLDRRLPAADLLVAVAKITSEPIEVVLDAVSLPDTKDVAFDLVSPNGVLVLILPGDVAPEKRAANPGKRIATPIGIVSLPHNVATGEALFAHLSTWLEEGLIKPNRAEVLPGGLGGIVSGLEKLKNDQVSGAKLVVRPEETE